MYFTNLLALVLPFFCLAHCAPRASTVSGLATLTAFVPEKPWLNGLKVENGNFRFVLGQVEAASYCPSMVSNCPPGDELVMYYPTWALSVEVPGGQQTYITNHGLLSYTQAHSMAMWDGPADASNGVLSFVSEAVPAPDVCVTDNELYDCRAGVGYWTFIKPDDTEFGIYACPKTESCSVGSPLYELYVPEPAFNRSDCTILKGLVAHAWTGANPATWQYT